MPKPGRPPARKRFDYGSLDAETYEFLHQQTSEIRGLMKRTAQGIFEIGQKLNEVKEKLGHGRFLDWLDAEFAWNERTARRFMSVAVSFSDISDNLSNINFAPSALYELAAPSTPETARTEAIARAQAGEAITHKTARAIKQKHTSPPNKSEPKTLPESELASRSQPISTPASSSRQGSKHEIVAIRPRQAPALEGATEFLLPQAGQTPLAPQPSPTVSAPDVPGIWWQFGGRHLLYCGNPNSPEFLERVVEEVQLLLAFPPTPKWQTAIRATTHLITAQHLPPGKNLEQLDEILESAVLFYSRLDDLVIGCFLPFPDLLSVLNRLERRGLLAEPDVQRCNAVVADWKRAGLKVERLG